jgi:hypothetical protein
MRRPCSAIASMQLFVFRRVDIVDAASKHGNSASLKRRKMSGRIDAAGKA